jgi:hypothetical protein
MKAAANWWFAVVLTEAIRVAVHPNMAPATAPRTAERADPLSLKPITVATVSSALAVVSATVHFQPAAFGSPGLGLAAAIAMAVPAVMTTTPSQSRLPSRVRKTSQLPSSVKGSSTTRIGSTTARGPWLSAAACKRKPRVRAAIPPYQAGLRA